MRAGAGEEGGEIDNGKGTSKSGQKTLKSEGNQDACTVENLSYS